MGNIRPNGEFDAEHKIQYLPNKYSSELSNYILNDGDLIIAMTDMATEMKILGIPTLVENTNGRTFMLNQRVGKLYDFKLDKINIEYLRYILSANQIKEYYKSLGGGTPSKANKEYWENGTIKWATVGDMNVETITKTELSITEIGLKNSSSNIIPKNGIIIATRVGLGKVCYLEDDIAINQDLKGLIPKDDKLNIRYLFNFFKNIEKYILSNGTGATVKGVKLEFIKELELPLPPLQTQQKIVSYLDEISQKMEILKGVQNDKMQNLKALKASILDQAFRGEL